MEAKLSRAKPRKPNIRASSTGAVLPFDSLNASPISSRANSQDRLLADVESGSGSSSSSSPIVDANSAPPAAALPASIPPSSLASPILLNVQGEFLEKYEKINKQYRIFESGIAFFEASAAASGPLFIDLNSIQALIQAYFSTQDDSPPWIGNIVIQCVTSLLPVIIINIIGNVILFERRKKMQALFVWCQDIKKNSAHDLMYYRNIQLISSAVSALFSDNPELDGLEIYLSEDFLSEYQRGHFNQDELTQFKQLLENEPDFLLKNSKRSILWTLLLALLTLASAFVVYLGNLFISSKKTSAVTTLIAASILFGIILASYRLEYSSRFFPPTKV